MPNKQKKPPQSDRKTEKNIQSTAGEDAVKPEGSSATSKPLELEKLPLAAKAHIEELEQQVAAAQDQALRAIADAQNARRRAEKDIESAHKYALERFVTALLEVVDNLERALQIKHDNHKTIKPFVEGVELTYRNFIDVLKSFKVNQVDPKGEPFDPQLHQAVSTVVHTDMEPNSIVDVMQKGYQLHGRLVRPAMVVVSKTS